MNEFKIELLLVFEMNGVENHYILIENYEGINLELLCLEYCIKLNKFANIFLFSDKNALQIHLNYPHQTKEEFIYLAENLVCCYFYNQEDISFEMFTLKKDLKYKE